MYTACVQACLCAHREFPCRDACFGDRVYGEVQRLVLSAPPMGSCAPPAEPASQLLCPSGSGPCPPASKECSCAEELEVDPQVSLLLVPKLHGLLRVADVHPQNMKQGASLWACLVEHYPLLSSLPLDLQKTVSPKYKSPTSWEDLSLPLRQVGLSLCRMRIGSQFFL